MALSGLAFREYATQVIPIPWICPRQRQTVVVVPGSVAKMEA